MMAATTSTTTAVKIGGGGGSTVAIEDVGEVMMMIDAGMRMGIVGLHLVMTDTAIHVPMVGDNPTQSKSSIPTWSRKGNPIRSLLVALWWRA